MLEVHAHRCSAEEGAEGGKGVAGAVELVGGASGDVPLHSVKRSRASVTDKQ